jgi:hypothetical protein
MILKVVKRLKEIHKRRRIMAKQVKIWVNKIKIMKKYYVKLQLS